MKTTKTQKWLVVLENGQYSRGGCIGMSLAKSGTPRCIYL